MPKKTVTIGSRAIAIEGSEDDAYFQGLDGFAAHLALLTEAMSGEAVDDGFVVDVGANIGLATIAMALAAPRAQVVAFEPSPANAAFLTANLAGNRIGNVEVVEAAVSNEPGRLAFREVGSFAAGSHVVGADHLDPKARNLSVAATTLDAHFPPARGPVRFVKIDCEGHEPEVLFGARELLARDRPKVFMEFNSWTLNGCAGHSPAAFADALWRNFAILGIAGRDVVAPAPRSPYAFLHTNLTEHGCVSDIVMRPNETFRIDALTDLTLPPSLRALLREAGLATLVRGAA